MGKGVKGKTTGVRILKYNNETSQTQIDPQNPGIQWVITAGAEDLAWDDFVSQHFDPQPEQTSAWGDVRSHWGWKPTRIYIKQDGVILGGAQIQEFVIKKILRVGYISRGPLIAEGVDPLLVLRAIKWLTRKLRLSYVAVSPPYFCESLVKAMPAEGFQIRPDALPPSVWHQATFLIDLNADLDTLFANLRPSVRNNVRRGLRSGLEVVSGSDKDLALFNELMNSLCLRRGTHPNLPGVDFIPKLWSRFAPRGWIHLLFIRHGAETISSHLILTVGKCARSWRVGWSGEHSKLFPNDVLNWEAIRWAKEHGFQQFDLLGVDRRDAEELLNGRAASEPYHCNITFFKAGFGGKLLLLPNEYCYFPNPILRWCMKLGLIKALETKWFTGFTRLLYRKFVPRTQ